MAWLLQETKHEGWEVISLPAMALERDPLGRQPGEALWPEAYPLPVLQEIRQTLGSRDWNALYQQCPLADADVIFSEKWLQFYDYTPRWIKSPQIVHSWDLSFGGIGPASSWVCGQVWLYDSDNRHCYLLAMLREQLGFLDTINAIRFLNEKYPASKILVEDKANGPAVIETLRSEIPYLEAVMPKGGKEDRAYACCPMFERGEVFLPSPKENDWVQPLLTEMQSVTQSVTDDCIDAMTQALGYFQSNGVHWLSIYSLS